MPSKRLLRLGCTFRIKNQTPIKSANPIFSHPPVTSFLGGSPRSRREVPETLAAPGCPRVRIVISARCSMNRRPRANATGAESFIGDRHAVRYSVTLPACFADAQKANVVLPKSIPSVNSSMTFIVCTQLIAQPLVGQKPRTMPLTSSGPRGTEHQAVYMAFV
jgi:hypothetical protein